MTRGALVAATMLALVLAAPTGAAAQPPWDELRDVAWGVGQLLRETADVADAYAVQANATARAAHADAEHAAWALEETVSDALPRDCAPPGAPPCAVVALLDARGEQILVVAFDGTGALVDGTTRAAENVVRAGGDTAVHIYDELTHELLG